MNPKLIRFWGQRGVGKTTSATYVSQWLNSRGIPAKLIGYADSIRTIAIMAFDLPPELVLGTVEVKNLPTNWKWEDIADSSKDEFKDKTGFVTIREFMQLIGTGIFRKHFNSEVWEKVFWNRIRKDHQESPNTVFVCHDARHLSEMRTTPNDMDVLDVLIVRNTGYKDTHSSEIQLNEMPPDSFDKIIYNDGERSDLYVKLNDVMNGVF